MKYPMLRTTLLLLAALFTNSVLGADKNAMNCHTGPVKKTYGNTPWLVYSCADSKTVVIVSDVGNPAMPYYFAFYIQNGNYTLNGEGSGSKQASDAAYNELSNLDDDAIRNLITETRNVK